MKLVDQQTLKHYHTIVGSISGGKVQLTPDVKGSCWLIWIDGRIVKRIRRARAMSFLDGWNLAMSCRPDRPIVCDDTQKSVSEPPQK